MDPSDDKIDFVFDLMQARQMIEDRKQQQELKANEINLIDESKD